MCKGKENIEAVIAETDNKREHFICTPVCEMLSKKKKKVVKSHGPIMVISVRLLQKLVCRL